MECVRRSVPNDNSCLFYAVAYLVDGPDAVSDATQKELRRVCAAQLGAHDDDGFSAGSLSDQEIELPGF